METTQRTSPRLDLLDAEKFEKMVESDVFKTIWDRIVLELRRSQEACEKSDSNLEVLRAQGAVKFGKMVLGLPEMLLSEMKGGMRPTNSRPISPKSSNLNV